MPDELIYMPRFWPWAALEWHQRSFTPAQAMKIDIYSFGMLALWLLSYGAREDSEIKIVYGLRATSGALGFAHQLIHFESRLQSIKLSYFLNTTLTNDTAFRFSDFKYLSYLLVLEEYAGCSLFEYEES